MCGVQRGPPQRYFIVLLPRVLELLVLEGAQSFDDPAAGRIIGVATPTIASLEKFFVDFLNDHGFFNPTPDAMRDHQSRKLFAVDKNNALAETF
jgi:hypothetical protein